MIFFFFFSETKVEEKWCIQTAKHIVEGEVGDKTTKCRELCIQGAKIRGLDGEATESRLCTQCGCMLNTDYI